MNNCLELNDAHGNPIKLPPRESEVLKLYVRGYSHKAIAKIMVTSDITPRCQIYNATRKLHVKTKEELLSLLEEQGFIQYSSELSIL